MNRFAQLAEKLGAKVDSVIEAVNRHKSFTRVQGTEVFFGSRWQKQRVA